MSVSLNALNNSALMKSGGTMTGNLAGNGSNTISGFSKIYNAVWNDYAEFFERGEAGTSAGDIIALDVNSGEERYIRASKENSVVVGVQSNEFAVLIGGEKPVNGEDYFKHNIGKFIPVGLAGRVRTKVSGIVRKGDYITVSDIPGVGVAVNLVNVGMCEFPIVGIALEDKNSGGVDLVRVLLRRV